MSRKETRWGHRHLTSDEEVKRIQKEFKNKGINITYLEADAILAARSKESFWTEKKLKDHLIRLRGIR